MTRSNHLDAGVRGKSSPMSCARPWSKSPDTPAAIHAVAWSTMLSGPMWEHSTPTTLATASHAARVTATRTPRVRAYPAATTATSGTVWSTSANRTSP